MRLLPHTWEGLHPAFPSNPSPSDSHISIAPPFAHQSLGIISGGSYGTCALACVAAAGVIKRSNSLPAQKTVGFLFKTTALAATLGVAGSVNHELGERRGASAFLRSRHIEVPPFKWVDRFGSCDADDWSIAGGVAGLFAASRRPRLLPSVSRTVWYAIHMMSGIWIASCGHAAQEVATVGAKHVLHRATYERSVANLQRVSYQPEVAREVVLDLVASIPEAIRQVQTGTIKLSPEIVAALLERTATRAFGPREPVSSSQSPFERMFEDPNYSDDFHRTHKPPGSVKPVPYSTRNYDWSQQPQHARTIASLEEHIAELRKKRQQLCREAEAIRTWLQQREARFYAVKLKAASDVEISALKPEERYLEKLGYWYLSTWMAVSEWDWMIAGATDHLAFAKASQQGLEWPQPAQPSKPNVKLEHMLSVLPVRLKALQTQRAALPGLIAQLKKDLSDASKTNSPLCTVIEGQIRGYEKILELWADDINVMERVWADAMKRSESGGDETSETR